MKTTKKALLAVVCAAALVFGSVFATYAYLTDSKSVTNTFTVGKVEITLDEVDVDDSTPNKDRDTENAYKLVPGVTYAKDPTVHVQPGSEKCYVFVKVENGIETLIDTANTIEKQIVETNKWTALPGVAGVYYKTADAVAENATKAADYVVFESFKVADTVTGAELAKVTEDTVIKVTAYAIQYAGFEDNVTGAWTAVSNAEKA